MVELALAELQDKRMLPDGREFWNRHPDEPTPSYKTVESLLSEFPLSSLTWIMGFDQFLMFKTWQKWEWLIATVRIAVLPRRGSNTPSNQTPEADLLREFKDRGADIKLIQGPQMDVSSSAVRARLAANQSIEKWVPSSVANYIQSESLYTSARSS